MAPQRFHQKAHLRSARNSGDQPHEHRCDQVHETSGKGAWAFRKDSTLLPSIHIKIRGVASCTDGHQACDTDSNKKGTVRSDQQSLLERDVAALVKAKTSSIVMDSGAERQRRWFRGVRENAHLRDPLKVAPKTCSASGTGPKMAQSVTKCCSRIASRIAKHEGAPSLRHAIIKPR